MSAIMKLNSKDKNIWFTSDSHYFHKNIAYGESVWNNKETGCRKFDTTQEMSLAIVKGINDHVNTDDILFHLGDWSFGGIQNIWNFRKQINCKNVHLIFGNHDHHIINNKGLPNNLYKGVPILSQFIFSSVQYYLEVEINGRMLCLSHYPMSEWNNRNKDSWMLHGHQHSKNTFKQKRLDVGVDKAFEMFNEYRPFNFKEIHKILNK